MVLPGFSVRDTNLSAGGQGREHDHCPAALPPQGEPGGTEAGEAAHISADWKNNAMEWVCVCCALFLKLIKIKFLMIPVTVRSLHQ